MTKVSVLYGSDLCLNHSKERRIYECYKNKTVTVICLIAALLQLLVHLFQKRPHAESSDLSKTAHLYFYTVDGEEITKLQKQIGSKRHTHSKTRTNGNIFRWIRTVRKKFIRNCIIRSLAPIGQK